MLFRSWLGLLLLATAALEAFNRLRYFALAALIAGLGFGVSLNLLNADGFIARQNVHRAAQGASLDRAYLVSLSDDAVPVMFEQFDAGQLSPDLHDQLGAALACWIAMQPDASEQRPSGKPAPPRPVVSAGAGWPSFHWARMRARGLYQSHQAQLESYPVRRVDWDWRVTVAGVEESCWGQRGD